MVTQDVQLFHATVRDNLTLFDRRIPDARMLERARRARAGRLAARGCRTGWTRAWRRAAAGCRRARRSCWPSRASSCATPAWSSSTRRRRGSTRPPSAASSAPIDRLLAGRTGIVIAHRLATVAARRPDPDPGRRRRRASGARAPRWPPTPTRASPPAARPARPRRCWREHLAGHRRRLARAIGLWLYLLSGLPGQRRVLRLPAGAGPGRPRSSSTRSAGGAPAGLEPVDAAGAAGRRSALVQRAAGHRRHVPPSAGSTWSSARCCGATCSPASCASRARSRCPPRPARRSAASATTSGGRARCLSWTLDPVGQLIVAAVARWPC